MSHLTPWVRSVSLTAVSGVCSISGLGLGIIRRLWWAWEWRMERPEYLWWINSQVLVWGGHYTDIDTWCRQLFEFGLNLHFKQKTIDFILKIYSFYVVLIFIQHYQQSAINIEKCWLPVCVFLTMKFSSFLLDIITWLTEHHWVWGLLQTRAFCTRKIRIWLLAADHLSVWETT